MAPAVEVAAFRIVMEAVTNAVRHADAQHVQVRVGYDDGVAVHVADDGRGLAKNRVPGVGLRGMTDRADEVGGRLQIRSAPAAGTAVDAWLPAADHD